MNSILLWDKKASTKKKKSILMERAGIKSDSTKIDKTKLKDDALNKTFKDEIDEEFYDELKKIIDDLNSVDDSDDEVTEEEIDRLVREFNSKKCKCK